jgi:hypothetical protein
MPLSRRLRSGRMKHRVLGFLRRDPFFKVRQKPFSPCSEPGRLIIRQRVRPGLRQIFFCLLAFSLGAAQLKIGRSGRAWRCPALRIGLAVRIHNAKIVLRVLIQIFRCDPVSACRRLTCQRDIAFKDLVRVAPDLYVRTVAVKSLDPMRHSRTVVVLVIPVVAAARAFVWSWSHDACLIAVDIIGPLSGRSIPLAPLGCLRWVLPLCTAAPSPRATPA